MRPSLHRIEDGLFSDVIRKFVASAKFAALGKSTQEGWARELRLAETPEILGGVSVHVIRPALVQAFLDGIAHLPGKQEMALKALRAVEKWGMVRDLLPHAITTGVEIVGCRDGHRPWRDDYVTLAEQHATRHYLNRIITLQANTGQRGSDIVKMRWQDIEMLQGHPGINVVQVKTSLTIWVPFTQPLIQAMAGWERQPGYIVRRDNGLPWSRKRLSTEWPIIRDSVTELRPLAEAGLVLHGLRATACIRLSRAGATTRQISDWIGMSEKMVCRYTRFSEQRVNAMAAVVHLDRYMAQKTDTQAVEKK